MKLEYNSSLFIRNNIFRDVQLMANRNSIKVGELIKTFLLHFITVKRCTGEFNLSLTSLDVSHEKLRLQIVNMEKVQSSAH